MVHIELSKRGRRRLLGACATATCAIVLGIAASAASASTLYATLTGIGPRWTALGAHSQSITVKNSGSGTWVAGFTHSGIDYYTYCSASCSVNAGGWGIPPSPVFCENSSGTYFVDCRFP